MWSTARARMYHDWRDWQPQPQREWRPWRRLQHYAQADTNAAGPDMAMATMGSELATLPSPAVGALVAGLLLLKAFRLFSGTAGAAAAAVCTSKCQAVGVPARSSTKTASSHV